ncbi:MAG TPA: hypothetical protein VE175_11710 [Woeseiaceae bacterium]|nr:hypothetical protein [Woeseiaceae bacterium]
MTRNLDWKWIGLGVLIMLALSIVAGLALSVLLAPELRGARSMEDIDLSGGQEAMVAAANFLVFAIGGYIVGLKSAGRTIIEPGISAALAILVALLISRNFSLGNLVAGALVPFLAGVLGGWAGERQQSAGGRPGGP